jgi:pyruvate dehydrogenase E2 component (dihydrolipoamide acetyltransferase)
MAFEFKLPDIGEGVVEGEIVRWLVEVGDQVDEDQPMVEVMTDKATVEIPSPVKGKVLELRGSAGDVVDVGEVLVVIDSVASAGRAMHDGGPGRLREVQSATDRASRAVADTVLATPAIRKQALSRGIDLTQVRGSGPGGRITAEDLDRFEEPPPDEVSVPPGSEEIEIIPYRGMRRRIGNHLVRAKQSAVHYSYLEEMDATELVSLRRAYLAEKPGRKLTFLPFILKAIVSGLKEFPLLNSSLDEEKQEIRVHRAYHIGVATATERGLVVPVIKDVDKKGILELGAEVSEVTELAREGKIEVADLKGGTFTVTSLGPLGGLAATPVINFPEVAILGVHKIQKRPVVINDQIEIREMMNLSLTCDHRVVDGVVAARFLHHVINRLEHPGLALLEE